MPMQTVVVTEQSDDPSGAQYLSVLGTRSEMFGDASEFTVPQPIAASLQADEAVAKNNTVALVATN